LTADDAKMASEGAVLVGTNVPRQLATGEVRVIVTVVVTVPK